MVESLKREGKVSKVNIDKIISSLGLSDSGKLLMFFDAAQKKEISIDENYVDSYIYLLNAKGILSFNYHFRFEPLPYSPLLKDDIYGLMRADYLSKGSNIHITSYGSKWVKQVLPKNRNAVGIYENLATCLSEFRELGETQLFKAVYATVTA